MFRKDQKPERTEQREQDIQLREKKPTNRFRIEKLEERIAPTHTGLGRACAITDGQPCE